MIRRDELLRQFLKALHATQVNDAPIVLSHAAVVGEMIVKDVDAAQQLIAAMAGIVGYAVQGDPEGLDPHTTFAEIARGDGTPRPELIELLQACFDAAARGQRTSDAVRAASYAVAADRQLSQAALVALGFWMIAGFKAAEGGADRLDLEAAIDSFVAMALQSGAVDPVEVAS